MSTTFYTGFLHIEPLQGDEHDTYQRLLFGSTASHGITPGLFWDMRSQPLPHSPYKPTQFLFVVEPDGIGRVFTVRIRRQNPTQVPTTDEFVVVPVSTEHVFSVYLGRGLNVLDVYVDGANGLHRIQSTSFTARDYATVMYADALAMYSYLWSPLRSIQSDITGPGSTGLASPLIDFDSELPQYQNLYRTARQCVVSVLINQPNSTHGVAAFAGALFQQTPILCKKPDSSMELDLDWLFQLPTSADTGNGVEVHVWNHDPELSRWSIYPKYLQTQNSLSKHNYVETETNSDSDSDTVVWNAVTGQVTAQDPVQERTWLDGWIEYHQYPASTGELDFNNPENSGYISLVNGGL